MKNLRWSWEGIVALVLAIGVVVGIALAESGRHVTPDEISLVDTVLGAIIGALAGFIAGRGSKRDDVD